MGELDKSEQFARNKESGDFVFSCIFERIELT